MKQEKTLEEFLSESKKEVNKSRWNDDQVFTNSDYWLNLIAKKKIKMQSPLVKDDNETT
jgi:hypothetical protein